MNIGYYLEQLNLLKSQVVWIVLKDNFFLKLLFSHVTSSPFQDDLEEENWGKLGGEVNTGHSFCTFIEYDHHHHLSSSSFSSEVFTEYCFHFFLQILPHFACQQYCKQHYKVITVELEQNNYGLGLSLAGAKVDNPHHHHLHHHHHHL